MASPLDSAITLEDVFAVVTAKRVPVAPELAGYLALEVAEKAEAAGGAGGEIDPRAVFIADEGTVALVRLPGASESGDAEGSIRGILADLLAASGSSTPALAALCKQPRGGSLRVLMEGIEAALIPVNRAAGRRALARLAREVKRASLSAGRSATSARPPSAPPPQLTPVPPPMVPPTPLAPSRPSPLHVETVVGLGLPNAAPAAAAFRPPSTMTRRQAGDHPAPAPQASETAREAVDVDGLIEQFTRSTTQSARAASRDLKALVDIGETTLPPEVRPKDSAPGDVDSLIAYASAAGELAAPTDPRLLVPTPEPLYASRSAGSLAAADPSTSEPAGPPAGGAAPARQLLPTPETVTRPEGAEAQARRLIPTPEPQRAPAWTPEPEPSEPHAIADVDPRQLPTERKLKLSSEWATPRKKRTDYFVVIAVLAIVAAGAAAVWLAKPSWITGRPPIKPGSGPGAPATGDLPPLALPQMVGCRAAIQVTDVPAGAEVLLRMGQAPVDVQHMPVGPRLEFVATAEGYAPKRVTIPEGTQWDKGPDGKPRYEAAVQLDKSTGRAKLGDAWPPGEEGSSVGGRGTPGTVRVVSTPRGAEVWMLAGLGPEAMIEQLPCDQPVDILVAGPTTFRKRLHATPDDFAVRPGETTPSRIVKLKAR